MARVKLNMSAFRAYRQSAEVQAACTAEAERIAAAANTRAAGECSHPEHAKFKVETTIDSTRGSVALVTTGGDAGCIAHNAAHNTLVKALGGG
ncbi:hypothetical protein JS533_001685 [Bifidobacterium amazonense]|uniref:Uncharacterized protein n=1 Tax=Bifidobacterium amazonense TaxID=2809027 RepID=A0ABS9VSN8_9BIFI|nr:hypothetical protein [Bifidobacterium amazonense]MCH9275000.1 hypothetical protein [Bifidobacterium amazonense]